MNTGVEDTSRRQFVFGHPLSRRQRQLLDAAKDSEFDMAGRGRNRSQVRGSSRGGLNSGVRPSLEISNTNRGRQGLNAPSTHDPRDLLRNRIVERAEAEEDGLDVDDEGEDDIGDDDQAEEEERDVVTPGTSISSIGNTTTTKSGWVRGPNWKKRGRSKMVNVSSHRLILKYADQNMFYGRIRTLMSTIYKAYCPGPYQSWKQWKKEDKLLCWEKFKKYFILKEDQNEDKARELFEAYGKANWTKFLYNARKEAKKANKHFKKDPNAKSPVEWIPESYWRELCKVWSNKKWRVKSKKAKENRTQEDPDNPRLLISTCGSKPLEQRFYEEKDESIGELPDQLRMFEIGHKKRNGEWSTQRAQKNGEMYKQKLDAAADDIISSTGSARPSNSQLDPKLELYREVDGVTNKKGQIVGFGRSYSAPSQGSSKGSGFVEMRAHVVALQKELNDERSYREQLEREVRETQQRQEEKESQMAENERSYREQLEREVRET